MRRLFQFGIPFLFVCVLASTASGFAAEGGIGSVDAAWMKAMKANDLEAVVACYASDAVLWLPGAPEANGVAAIRAAYQGFLAANTVQDVSVSNSHSRTSGNVSVDWGNFTLMIAPKSGGAPISMKGRYAAAAERRHGRWVYVVDHASADPAPSGAPAK